jgi:hypothetical protein
MQACEMNLTFDDELTKKLRDKGTGNLWPSLLPIVIHPQLTSLNFRTEIAFGFEDMTRVGNCIIRRRTCACRCGIAIGRHDWDRASAQIQLGTAKLMPSALAVYRFGFRPREYERSSMCPWQFPIDFTCLMAKYWEISLLDFSKAMTQ